MSRNKYTVLITCEHAGNDVPAEYAHMFTPHKKLLQTHRGYDIGAYSVAKALASALSAPIFFHTTTRLLVDVNRSLSSRSLFFLPLSENEKHAILFHYYLPYRKQVEEWIAANDSVLHLSIHSFTPVLNGVERTCDIGLLYDPQRQRENTFCLQLKKELRSTSNFIVRNNYPYKGVADGFTTHLRKLHSDKRYCGIEIELNQKLMGAPTDFSFLREAILRIIHDKSPTSRC